MPDLERALRDLLSDDRLEVPVRPGAVQAVHTGVRRRQRARVVLTSAGTAVLVVAATAAGVAVHSSSRPAPRPGPSNAVVTTPLPGPAVRGRPIPVIAWSGLALDHAVTAAADPGAVPAAGVHWCRPDQLALSAGGFQHTATLSVGSVVVTNHGAPCGMQGVPTVTGYSAHHRAVTTAGPIDDFVAHPWFVLRTGQQARALVSFGGLGSRCLGPITEVSVDLRYGDPPLTAAATDADGTAPQPTCGQTAPARRLAHYVALAHSWTRPDGTPRLPVGRLHPEIRRVQRNVMQGSLVHFRVRLRLPTGRLDSCQPFLEQLVARDGTVVVGQEFQLPCRAIDTSRSTHPVVEMRLRVPAEAAPGLAHLTWETPRLGEHASTGDVVRIVAAPPACRQHQLQLRPAGTTAGNGRYAERISLRNTSGRVCSLRGYPGVALVAQDGTHPATDAVQMPGTDMETVVVRPHRSVSFVVSSTDGSGQPAGSCRPLRGFLVIAPGLARQVFVRGTAADCHHGLVYVSPVVAGRTAG